MHCDNLTAHRCSSGEAVYLHSSLVVEADEPRPAVVLTKRNLGVWIFPELSTDAASVSEYELML